VPSAIRICITSHGELSVCFSLGGTLSNYLGQLIVEEYGHTASLQASLIVSLFPILLFTFFSETLGERGRHKSGEAAVHTLPIIQIV
jgi:hypothetical protein